MIYKIPFILHNKKNEITIEYKPVSDKYESGFHALNLPFDTDECKGYPMIHAFIHHSDLKGYERYCGWIQILKKEEYHKITDDIPSDTIYELDIPENFREYKLPYFAYGYPAELFDAPCHNLKDNEKLVWRAYTYLVDIPSVMNDFQLSYLAGFSWGYSENCKKEVSLIELELLNEEDWNCHKKYIEF